MSLTDETSAENRTVAVLPAASFKERLSRRRQELEADAVFEIEVPGYDDLWARYRVLGYEEVRGISIRIEHETREQIQVERLTAAATLAEANTDLLEYKGQDEKGKPVFEALGCRWGWRAAQDLFGIENVEGMAARDVMLAVFPYPRDLLLSSHFEKYLEQAMSYLPEVEELMHQELPGPSGPITSDSSQPQR